MVEYFLLTTYYEGIYEQYQLLSVFNENMISFITFVFTLKSYLSVYKHDIVITGPTIINKRKKINLLEF